MILPSSIFSSVIIMGDSITIPRTFAGLIGVADVQNSVKRHYLNIPINQNDSTGVVFGGSGTTGFNFFSEKRYS